MRIKSILATSAFALTLGFANAQDVPPLSDVIQNMDPKALEQMGTVGGQIQPITGDVDAVINSAVNDAVKSGVITSDQAGDMTASLTVINSNAQFFDFDILATIGEALNDPDGDVSMADIRTTLEGFNQLSDAGKALVGKESFEASEAQLGQLSDADRAIVTKLPVFQADMQENGNMGN